MPRNKALTLLIVIAGIVAACNARPNGDLLAKGEHLFNTEKWGAAIPVLKQRLLQDPDDAGAHYYLGRCYLAMAIKNIRKAYPVIAEGELRTALNLFIKGGRHSPIPRFNDTYFELSCHYQLANVYLFQLSLMEQLHATPPDIEDKLELLEREVNAARAIKPNAPEIKQYDQQVQDIRNRYNLPNPSKAA